MALLCFELGLDRISKMRDLELIKAKGELVSVAARLVECFALIDLDVVCEEQKSITTARLQRISDEIAEELKKESINIKRAIDRIKT